MYFFNVCVYIQKNFLSASETDSSTLGVSLPIGERLSAKVGG